jgi:hypothetical protein
MPLLPVFQSLTSKVLTDTNGSKSWTGHERPKKTSSRTARRTVTPLTGPTTKLLSTKSSKYGKVSLATGASDNDAKV